MAMKCNMPIFSYTVIIVAEYQSFGFSTPYSWIWQPHARVLWQGLGWQHGADNGHPSTVVQHSLKAGKQAVSIQRHWLYDRNKTGYTGTPRRDFCPKFVSVLEVLQQRWYVSWHLKDGEIVTEREEENTCRITSGPVSLEGRAKWQYSEWEEIRLNYLTRIQLIWVF